MRAEFGQDKESQTARVRAPQDKSLAEGNVKFATT